ncbi:MAG: sensor histidine kinase, partial [Planctomycetaceae bacterium]
AEELELNVRDARHELVRYLDSHDPQSLRRALDCRNDIERWFRQADRLATTEPEQASIAHVRQGLDRFFEQLSRLVQDSDGPIPQATVSQLRRILTEEVLVHARQYLDINERELENSNRHNRAMSDRLALGLLLLGTCGSIAGLVAGYGAARGISRSIFQLSVPIRDVAGKLNEVVGPVTVSADPGFEDLESVLQTVSAEVAAVVEQLQTSHREIMRADQLAAVGQLAAGLAHELRNPLMCIKVLVQSARCGEANGLDERDLQVLDEEITRLDQLLQGFLDFARPAKLETAPMDLRRVVEQTLSVLAPRAGRRDVTIRHDPPERPVMVVADEAQIRQVALNLLLNALDAVARGGRIDVEIARPDGAAVLRIADDGRGLPAEHSGRIFEPFFSTKETGLGLGLAMCRRIIESHGGSITAAGRAEGGAVFTVRLPAACGLAGSSASRLSKREPAKPQA